MDKHEAVHILANVARCYLDIFKEDFLEDENQKEYVEILQALEVLNG